MAEKTQEEIISNSLGALKDLRNATTLLFDFLAKGIGDPESNDKALLGKLREKLSGVNDNYM